MGATFKRACEADYCGEIITSPRAFCPGHWGKIPREVKVLIFDAEPGTERDRLITHAVALLRASDGHKTPRRK